MQKKIITLTTDFGKQTQGIGNMEGVIYQINPDAKVIHLMHGIENFDLLTAARTMETVYYMPIGFHVCVVDPSVGTKRKAIIVKVKRGDYFIGPDNGCLLTAARLLGGVEKIVLISNEKYLLLPVSPIFHGRHVFAPVAAHLSLGVPMEEFGKELLQEDVTPAIYDEAHFADGMIKAKVIHVNHFGSLHLNILHAEFDKLDLQIGEKVELQFGNKKIILPFLQTFGDVASGEALIMYDDYQRIEIAVNKGNFAERTGLKIGDCVVLRKVV